MPSRAGVRTRSRVRARLELLENWRSLAGRLRPVKLARFGLWMTTFCHRAAFENRPLARLGIAGRVIPLPDPSEGRHGPICPVSGHSGVVAAYKAEGQKA